MEFIESFHKVWYMFAIASTGLVGMWGLGLAITRSTPRRAFEIARGASIGAILLQIVAGVYLYSNGVRPGNAIHVFYGVVIFVTLALVYVYRTTMARKPALTYGLLLLFVMGLGLRAWANVN